MNAFRVLALLVLAACSAADSPDAPEFTVTDSAGIEVVRNGAAGMLPQAALDAPERVLRIGAVDGPAELQFFRLWALAVDEQDNIYAADAGHGEVRMFDAHGAFVRSFGRKGRGPGEFEFPASLWVRGDSLFVFDNQLMRLSVFDRAGANLGTILLGDTRARRIYPVRPVPDGWVVMPWQIPIGFDYQHGVVRVDTSRLVLVSSPEAALGRFDAAAVEATAANPAGWREIVSIVSGRRIGNQTPIFMSAIQPLFEPQPSYTVDALGRTYYTTAADYVIDTYDSSGTHVRRLTRAYTPVPVTDAMIAEFASRAKAYWDTATIQGEAAAGKSNDEARASAPTVATLPPIGRMYAAANGALWVERRDLVPDPVALEWSRGAREPTPTKWDLFTAEGRFLGTVTLPPTFSPRVVGDRWVLGIERDEVDVQYIARYRIGEG